MPVSSGHVAWRWTAPIIFMLPIAATIPSAKSRPAEFVTTYAGLTGPGNAGSTNANGTNARFNFPTALAVDGVGRVFVADTGNDTIRKIGTNGGVVTIAGFAGLSGTNDGITNAFFSQPYGLAVDADDNIYVADTLNDTIRVVTFGGAVSTIARIGGTPGTSVEPARMLYSTIPRESRWMPPPIFT